MSIFGREDEPQAAPAPQPTTPTAPSEPASPARGVTVISSGTTIQGEIGGATEIRVEGVVDGKIDVDAKVSIASGGRLRGEVHARSVVVAGQVKGNILGDENAEIKASGKLEGDVKAPRVSIADGAFFKGRVEMASAKAAADVSKPAAKETPAPVAQPAATAKLDRSGSPAGSDSSAKTGTAAKTGATLKSEPPKVEAVKSGGSGT